MGVIKEIDADKVLASIIIPPRPTILLSIKEAQDKDADLYEIAELISQDIGLSAAILKAINSSFYGLPDKVTSLTHAVSLLGMKNTTMLITGLSLRKIPSSVNLDVFWNHSAEVASISAFLAKQLGSINKDEAQLFGLFHDCGKVLLSERFKDYQDTLKMMRDEDQSLIILENKFYMTDHTLGGSLLSKSWCLPERISLAVRHHHDIALFLDGSIPDQVFSLVALIHLAEYLAHKNTHYMDSEWLKYADEFMECLLISDDELTDLHWQVNQLQKH
jgi:putative nucleotidyltransferase with HDIG domain